MPHLFKLIAKLILRDNPFDCALCFGRVVANEFGCMQSPLERFDRSGLEKHAATTAGNFTMSSHGCTESVPVEGELSLGGQRFEELRRKSVGGVHLGSFGPADLNFVVLFDLAEDAIGEVINIGSGFEISVGETAALIAELMEAEIKITCADERLRPEASEVERLFADIAKAEKLLDWTPRYGGHEGFSRGLAETISWFRDPKNLKRYKADRYNF